MICGARNRSGGRCKHLAMLGKRRCKLHGGMSTGAKVHRSRPHLRGAHAAWLAQLHAAGLKHPGGRKPGRHFRPPADEREVLARMIEDVLETLPAAPSDKPIERWTAAELLNDGARLSLLRLREAVTPPLDFSEPKVMALQIQAAGIQVKALKDVQIAALQARREDGIDRLKAAIEAFKKQEAAKVAAPAKNGAGES